MDVRVPAAAVDHHQQWRPADGHAARGTRAGDLERRLQGRAACTGEHCRPGRSCASAVLHLRQRRSRTRCGRARSPHGKTCFLPATGLLPDCRRPSRDRCGPATGPPTSSWQGKRLIRCDRLRRPVANRGMSSEMHSVDKPRRRAVDSAALEKSICVGDAGAARLPAVRRTLGVRARSGQHDPVRIRAVPPLSRRARRQRARSQDRQLSAAHPGRAWRLAAGAGRRRST